MSITNSILVVCWSFVFKHDVGSPQVKYFPLSCHFFVFMEVQLTLLRLNNLALPLAVLIVHHRIHINKCQIKHLNEHTSHLFLNSNLWRILKLLLVSFDVW